VTRRIGVEEYAAQLAARRAEAARLLLRLGEEIAEADPTKATYLAEVARGVAEAWGLELPVLDPLRKSEWLRELGRAVGRLLRGGPLRRRGES